jgi:hypothetical protein
LIALRKKHFALSERIEKMQQSPGSNYLEIKQLKKEKLRLKEEITRLQNPKRLTQGKLPEVALADLTDEPEPFETMSDESLMATVVDSIMMSVNKAA